MAERDENSSGKLAWLFQRKVSAVTALVFVLVARNVEGLAEHLGAASLLTQAYDWITSRDWIAPLAWLGNAIVSIGQFFASDLVLGVVLASVFFAFLDYRHKIVEWWEDRRNPSDPRKRLRKHIKKIARLWSDPSKEDLNHRLAQIKACREHFLDEPHLIYALDTIVMSVEHNIQSEYNDFKRISVDLWVFVGEFNRALKKDKEKRECEMARLLKREKSIFTRPVFSERMVNAPVSLSEDETRQSREGIEEETQPKTRRD